MTSFQDLLKQYPNNPYNIGPSYIFKFGKHSGKTALEIFQTDLDYCEWLLNEKLSPNMYYAQRSIIILSGLKYLAWKGNKKECMTGDVVFKYGKHSGKKLSYIIDNDPKYMDYFMNNPPLKEAFYDFYLTIEQTIETMYTKVSDNSNNNVVNDLISFE